MRTFVTKSATALFVAASVAFIPVAAHAAPSEPAAASVQSASKKSKLVLSVTNGSGDTVVSWLVSSGSNATSKVLTTKKSKWKKVRTVNTSSFGMATIAASAVSGKKVSCKITLGGKVVDKDTAKGRFGVASCSYDWGY